MNESNNRAKKNILVEENMEKDKSENQESYKIYDFFKKNPGLLAGVGSLLVVVLSATINFCSYAYDSAILNYWNVDPVYMDISLPSRIHGTVVSIAFVSIYVYCILVLEDLGKKGASVKNFRIYLKQLCKQNWKEFRRIILKEIKAKVLRKAEDYSLERSIASNREIVIKSRKNEFKKQCAGIRKQIRKSVGLLWFLLAVSFYVWISLGNATFWEDYVGMQIVLIVVSVAISAIFIFAFYFMHKRSFVAKKHQHECAKNDYEYGSIGHIFSSDKRIHTALWSGNVNFRISDKELFRRLCSFFQTVGALILALILIFQSLGYYTALQKHSFMVVSEIDKQYVVLYNNGETAILARYEENDNIIDTGKQKVVSVENLEFAIKDCGDVVKGTIEDLGDKKKDPMVSEKS